jgi:hypothetical protein
VRIDVGRGGPTPLGVGENLRARRRTPLLGNPSDDAEDGWTALPGNPSDEDGWTALLGNPSDDAEDGWTPLLGNPGGGTEDDRK